MALILWYPLNKDVIYENSGENYQITNNNVTITDDGIIGKGYYFNGTNAYLSISPKDKIKQLHTFTITCWVKPDSYSSGAQYGIIGTPYYYSGIGLYLRNIPGADIGVQFTDANNNRYFAIAGTLDYTKWSHIAVSWDGVKFKIYIDGIKIYEGVNGPNTGVNRDITELRIGHCDGIQSPVFFPGKISDVRIYDEALSDNEIYSISKAKILHYTFNNSQEPTINMFNGYNISIDTAQQNISAGTDSIGSYFIKSDNSVWWAGIRIPNIPIQSDQYYTWSFEILCDVSFNLSFDANISATGATGNDNWTDQSYTTKYDTPGQWKRVYHTIKSLAGLTNPFIHTSFCPQDSAVFGKKIYYRNFQLENKPYMTAYTPNTRYGIINDISGFNNNIIFQNIKSPQISDLSVIGTNCIYFNNSQKYDGNNFIEVYANNVYIPKKGTLTGFIKGSASSQVDNNIYPFGWRNFCILGPQSNKTDVRSGLIYYYDSSNYTTVNWGAQNFFDGQWHMYTVTWDADTRQVSLYKDGVKIGTQTSSTLFHTGTFRQFVLGSAWSTGYGGFTGYIDDIRVYATILSDQEILNLYQSKFKIDNKYNVYSDTCISNISSYNQDSRIINLVENGCGNYKNNYNFSGFTYNPSTNSFETSTYQSAKMSDNFIPVDINSKYILEGEITNLIQDKLGYNYLGVACYDKNFNFISHESVTHFSNTRTTLAQDLKPGDTIVYLTSSANWNNSNPGGWHSNKVLGVYSKDATYEGYGNNYERATYTVEYLYVDNAGPNTITLTNSWSGPTIPAGTKVANCYYGTTYNYIAAGYVNPSTWTKYLGYIGPGQGSGSDNIFRYGTKYVKILFLCNYTTSGSSVGFRNIKFYNTSKVQNAVYKNIYININKNSSIVSNGLNEIGPTDGLIAWWKLNTDTRDYSGYGWHGTLQKTGTGSYPIILPGYNGKMAYYFNRIDDTNGSWISTNLKPQYDEITVAVLFKKSSLGHFLTIGDNDYNPQIYNDKLILYILGTQISGSTTLDSNWHCAIFTTRNQNTDSYAKIFLDGNLDGEGTLNKINTRTYPNPLAIGQDWDGSTPTGFFGGYMCDLRIYNRVLSDEEIKILTNVMLKNKALQLHKSGIVYFSGNIKEGF